MLADPVYDHATVLKIAGKYAMDFAFDETVWLQPGYARAPAMRSAVDEAVIVIEDTPIRLSFNSYEWMPKLVM